MISFRPYKILIISFLILSNSNIGFSQFNWDWKDPLDLDAVDIGDNKFLLYNLVGVGLIHFLAPEKSSIRNSESFTSLSIDWYKEYRKTSKPTILDLKYRKGRKWKKKLWLGYEISAIVVKSNTSTGGLGMSPFFTWNMINSKRLRLSFDGGVGPVLFFHPFPNGGTRFNFTTTYSIELEYKTNTLNYALGGRNTHISNAEIKGRERNIGFDGAGIYAAVRW